MARRKTEVFSMSFLDCITCAFGSVVLVYVLISAQGGLRKMSESKTQRAEVTKMEEEVLEGYQHLVQLRNSMLQTEDEKVKTEGLGTRVLTETERLKVELADSDKQTLSRREAIERLKADLKSLEEGARRLEGATTDPSATGTRVHRHRRPAIPDRPESRRRAHSGDGRRLGQHARRNGRERPAHAQHVRHTQADVGQVAAHPLDHRLDCVAAAAGIAIPAVCLQHQDLGPGAEFRRQMAQGQRSERTRRRDAGTA